MTLFSPMKNMYQDFFAEIGYMKYELENYRYNNSKNEELKNNVLLLMQKHNISLQKLDNMFFSILYKNNSLDIFFNKIDNYVNVYINNKDQNQKNLEDEINDQNDNANSNFG